MLKKLLLSIVVLCCFACVSPAFGGDVYVPGGTTEAPTHVAGAGNIFDESGTNYYVVGAGSGDTGLTLGIGSDAPNTGWRIGSITVEDGGNHAGVLTLDGNNTLNFQIDGAIQISDDRDVPAGNSHLLVTGKNATLDAVGGLHITGSAFLTFDKINDVALDAMQTAVVINSTRTDSAIDLDAGGGARTLILAVQSLVLRGGNVILGDEHSTFSALQQSYVGGYRVDADSPYTNATMEIRAGGSVDFRGGLSIRQGGTLSSAAAGAILQATSLGLSGGVIENEAGGVFTIQTNRLTVSGDTAGVIDTTGGKITFKSYDGTATTSSGGTALSVSGDLEVKGNNSLEFYSYAQTGGNVSTVSADPATGGIVVLRRDAAAQISGGTFAAAARFDGGASFTGQAKLEGVDQTIILGSGKSLSMGANTEINLRNDKLTITGGATAISGSVYVGGTASAANTLESDGNIEFTDTGRLYLSGDFARVVTAADTAQASNTLVQTTGSGTISHHFDSNEVTADQLLLGLFTIRLEDTAVYVAQADRRGMLLDGTEEDYRRAEDILAGRYGPGVDDGFALNIYKSVVDPAASPGNIPPYDALVRGPNAAEGSGTRDEASYAMNRANFEAFAMGGPAADASLVALYNGMNNSGVVDVAITTANTVIGHSRDRLRRIGEVRAAVRDCVGSDSALAATIINSEQANRVWVSGFGMWEDAGEREGSAGYRYDSGGFIGGYDHAFGPVSVGGLFAYTKGSFYDKTALSHDSDISSCTVGVHGAYYHPEGFYATVAGGWTYSDNEIRELRRDATRGTAWNTADYKGDTWSGSVELGYDYRAVPCLSVTPSIGFTYIYSRSKNHTEYLGGVAAGRARGVQNDAAYLPIRLEVGYEIPVGTEASWRVAANGGYAYNFAGDGIDGSFDPYGFANAATHTMRGREPGRHNFNAGANLRFTSDRLDFGLDYAYFHRASQDAHRVMGSIGFRF